LPRINADFADKSKDFIRFIFSIKIRVHPR